MGTPSRIGIYENNEVKSIYCHFDGYIDYNGEILFKHYNTPERVKELIALGDLSCLGEEISKEKIDWTRRYTDSDYYEEVKNKCLPYADRGETEINATTSTIENYKKLEGYNYLFKDNKWYVSCKHTDWQFEPLENYVTIAKDL